LSVYRLKFYACFYLLLLSWYFECLIRIPVDPSFVMFILQHELMFIRPFTSYLFFFCILFTLSNIMILLFFYKVVYSSATVYYINVYYFAYLSSNIVWVKCVSICNYIYHKVSGIWLKICSFIELYLHMILIF
jgi:hypothetical protein